MKVSTRSSSLLYAALCRSAKNDCLVNRCESRPYACSASAAPLSTPLALCPQRYNSGTVPLALTETNASSRHPEFGFYVSFGRKVSKDLLDLPGLYCWDNFAKHAAVRRGNQTTTRWPRGTRTAAEKDHSRIATIRPNKELFEIRLFSLRTISICRSKECLHWYRYWSSLFSVPYFSASTGHILIIEEKHSVTEGVSPPAQTLNPLSAPTSRNSSTHKVKQQNSRYSRFPVRNQQFLWASGVQQLGSFRQFHLRTSPAMAKSKFEYVRQFEVDDPCLPNCWVVVRIDGKAFHKFTDAHHYMKPNDERGLSLMTRAAQNVMSEFNEIVLAYGQSDEYSFVFHKNCKLYNRRASKIMTNVVSLFASSFTLFWPRFFNSQELQYPPSFDGRVVLYPSDDNLRDYLSWRQADCHINNLYNTCFWKLVQEKGLTANRAAERLKGTLSSDKNELLYSEFNINYNNLAELYRKGSVLIRPKGTSGEASPSPEKSFNNHTKGQDSKASKKPGSVVLHTDIIGKQFWEDNPHILNPRL